MFAPSVSDKRHAHDPGAHPDEVIRDHLPKDAKAAGRLGGSLKRGIEALHEHDNDKEFPSAKKLALTDDPSVLKIKGCTPVVQIMREDAFPLGLQARNMYEEKLLKQLEIEIPEDNDDNLDLVPFTRSQTKTLQEVNENKSTRLGAQLASLYEIMIRRHVVNRQEGKDLLQFALRIIDRLPNKPKDLNIDLNQPIEEKYLKIAQALADKLPVDLPENEVKKLALKMQQGEENPEEEPVADKSREEAEELAIKQMGYLLFLAHRNLDETIKCVRIKDFDQALDQISDCVGDIIAAADQRINQHAEEHRKVAIQDFEEAKFHKISIELADHLLLESGTINFGLINVLTETLIPEEWTDLLAVETLMMVVEDLAQDPLIWREIAEVNVPKTLDNPSNEAIRVCLGLKSNEKITRRHAQQFVLSALLGHYRQAKVGTCFATAFLIKALQSHPIFFIRDLKRLTEEGILVRFQFGEPRNFPYHARVTKEFLDTIIEVDPEGNVLDTMKYDYKPFEKEYWPKPTGGYLYESPGIIAACQAMRLDNAQEAVMSCLPKLTNPFATEDLLKLLAELAYQQQEASRYAFRAVEKMTQEQFLAKAEFAFGVQTNHPLHRAYDMVASSSVCYFGSQYIMPYWIYDTMTEVLEKADKGYPPAFQAKYKKLLREMFLPMLIRMRFRYNPHMDQSLRLFNDGNHGRHNTHYYGYELCDGGLPEDFEYSTDLFTDYKSESTYLTLQRFKKYPSEHTWKPMNTEKKFQEFLNDVIQQTAEHFMANNSSQVQKEWRAVADKMVEDIYRSTFCRRMVYLQFGRDSDQKKNWKKNPHNIDTTPWRFGWGGDVNEVMKTYFGFIHAPSQMKKYNGTPKEVLAKCINFVKGQPENFKEDLAGERSLHITASPVHVFLLKPNEESYEAAWRSEEPTNDYIKRVVEMPGLEVANSRLSFKQRKEMIEFVANNLWVNADDEKDDFERLQLTEYSKNVFDQLLAQSENISLMSVKDFEMELASIVYQARAADPQIKSRNTPWERQFARILRNFVIREVPENRRIYRISEETKKAMVAFARDRVDTIALSEAAVAQFLSEAEKFPARLSVKEFRIAVVKAAYEAHKFDACGNDPEWKGLLCKDFDTQLFKVLTEEDQEKLIKSAIVTHDPNWKCGIYDWRTCFMVNPGTGKIELVRYLPDLQRIRFMKQDDWFPRKEDMHGYWNFPDNYRVFANQPLFNVKKHMDL